MSIPVVIVDDGEMFDTMSYIVQGLTAAFDVRMEPVERTVKWSLALKQLEGNNSPFVLFIREQLSKALFGKETVNCGRIVEWIGDETVLASMITGKYPKAWRDEYSSFRETLTPRADTLLIMFIMFVMQNVMDHR